MKSRYLISAAGAVTGVAVAGWALWDYRVWRRLGPGGLPYNLRGWLRTSMFRLLAHDPYAAEGLRPLTGSAGDISSLETLPRRHGRRPRTNVHPVPRRQLDQLASEPVLRDLDGVFRRAVERYPGVLRFDRSHYELHHEAIFLVPSSASDPLRGGSYGEVAHTHALEGSMHMVLSPSDAIFAIEAGWAERHGLAGKVLDLPVTYVLVYAPRNLAELASTTMLLEAAIAYMAQYHM